MALPLEPALSERGLELCFALNSIDGQQETRPTESTRSLIAVTLPRTVFRAPKSSCLSRILQTEGARGFWLRYTAR